MTIAAALLGYALGVGTIGSVLLGRAAWPPRAPMLGILTYLAAAWSSVAALGLAGLTLAVHATALGSQLSSLIGVCVLRLRAEYDAPGGALVAFAGLAVALVLLARTAATAVSHLHAVRQHALQHAQAARLIGRPEPDLGAILAGPAEDPAPALVPAGHGAQPAVGLAAAATDAVQRISRLLHPAEPLSRFRRQFLRAEAAALALTPVVLALTPALVALALGRVPGA